KRVAAFKADGTLFRSPCRIWKPWARPSLFTVTRIMTSRFADGIAGEAGTGVVGGAADFLARSAGRGRGGVRSGKDSLDAMASGSWRAAKVEASSAGVGASAIKGCAGAGAGLAGAGGAVRTGFAAPAAATTDGGIFRGVDSTDLGARALGPRVIAPPSSKTPTMAALI